MSGHQSSPRPSHAQGRPSLDVLVQNATVQAFQAHGVAVAPVPRVSGAGFSCSPSDLAGTISFSSDGSNGLLVLCVPPSVLVATNADASDSTPALDWTRELTNQLMGRIKNRLLRFQVGVRLGVPSSMKAEYLSGVALGRTRSPSNSAVYQFRSMRGDVNLAIYDLVDESRLVYSGVELASEGDILLF